MLAIGLGPTELLIILAVILLIFGGSQLPKLARSLGQAKREFERGTEEGEEDEKPAKKEKAGD